MSTKKGLSVEEFTLKAIRNLRKPPFKGIHVVYSQFNDAFRKYFPGKGPKEELQKLMAAGKIEIIPTKGGARIYLPGEGPSPVQETDDVLKRILKEDV